MPTASLLVRNLPHYRRDAFERGLRQAGFAIAGAVSPRPSPHDVLVIWNRHGQNHVNALRYEAAGAAVIVAENGYIDMADARKTFALALNHHNGAGMWPEGAQKRAPLLGVRPAPWRGNGQEGPILLLPQRGIGEPGVAMPLDWEAQVRGRLRRAMIQTREIRTRWHPNGRPLGQAYSGPAPKGTGPTLEEELAGVGLCVTWASGAGIKALIIGVPVIFELASWVGGMGGSYGTGTLYEPRLGNREAMLERLAWAQWSVDEVETGEPFRRLMELHDEMKRIGSRLA